MIALYLFRSSVWHDKASEPVDAAANIHPSEEESKRGISMVAFLLQVSAKCVLPHPHPSWRMQIMKQISHRILSNFLSLDDVLVHPFRLRYRILRMKMKEIQSQGQETATSSSRVVKRLREEVESQSDEVVDIGLFQSIPIHHRRQLIDLAKAYLSSSSSSASKEKERDRRHRSTTANVIAWKDVKDLETLSSEISSCPNLEDQYFHPKLPWSMAGLTMFAQSMIEEQSSSAIHDADEEGDHLLSSIYSPSHIYDMFSIYLSPMLQISADEGLAMANRLSQLTSSSSSAGPTISYLPHSLHLQDADSSSSAVPTHARILEEISSSASSSREIKAVGIMSARSGDSLQLLQSLINSIASCPDNQRRIQGYAALKSMLTMFEERSRLALLRKLVDDCPFASLTGLLIDIVRDNCQHASRLSTELWAPLTNSVSALRTEDGDRSMEVYQCADLQQSQSPFWSPLVLRLFVDKLFSSLSSMPIAEIIARIDEINATVALLQFIVLRIEMAAAVESTAIGPAHSRIVNEILYPVLLLVQGANHWIDEKMKHFPRKQEDVDADILRVQLLSSNLDHLMSSMKRVLSNHSRDN
jgi:hypothetical protein